MLKKVLWIEDEESFYLENLKGKPDHIEVTVARTLTEAEEFIRNNQYDLLILDVMIPTKSEEEEKAYNPSETDKGRKTGLVFYKRWKDKLYKAGTTIFVFTIVGYKSLLNEFIEAGLPKDCFATKYSLIKPSDFWTRICSMLKD